MQKRLLAMVCSPRDSAKRISGVGNAQVHGSPSKMASIAGWKIPIHKMFSLLR